MVDQRKIAYFSMEVALKAEMPTYSGGRGVLAGDTIRAPRLTNGEVSFLRTPIDLDALWQTRDNFK